MLKLAGCDELPVLRQPPVEFELRQRGVGGGERPQRLAAALGVQHSANSLTG